MRRPPIDARICARQRGSSLIFALIALAGLSVAGAAMMRSSDTAALVVGNLGFQDSATRVTELGIEQAIAGLSALDPVTRRAHASSLNYYASLESVGLEPSAARLSAATAHPITDAATANTVRYVTERLCQAAGAANTASPANPCVMNGTEPLYRVTALAVGPRFASETTQAFFSISGPVQACGIMTQQTVTVSGQTAQSGTNSCYHSNGNLNINGTVTTSGLVATANGTATNSGGGVAVGDLVSVASVRETPPVDPSSHRTHATLVFSANGNCGSGAGTGLRNCTGFAADAWEWSGSRWIHKSGAFPAGLYYFEEDVELPLSIGSAGAPVSLSLISEKSIKISGSVFLRDYVNAAHPPNTNRVFIMAGGDLELPGGSTFSDDNASPNFENGRTSMIAAGAELKVNGSITLEANLVARNEALPAGAENWASENLVSGEVTQAYDGNGGAMTAVVARHRWRLLARN